MQGQLRNFDTVACAVIGGLLDDFAYFRRRLMPGRQRRGGEQAGRERCGVHQADAFFLADWNQLERHVVLQGVVIVRQQDVDVSSLQHVPKHLHRVTADTDETHFSFFNLPAERRQRLFDDLGHLDEFEIVAEHDVQVVDLQPFQGNVDALFDPLRTEVEVCTRIATQLRAQVIAVAGHLREDAAKQHFAHSTTVKRRRINEVYP